MATRSVPLTPTRLVVRTEPSYPPVRESFLILRRSHNIRLGDQTPPSSRGWVGRFLGFPRGDLSAVPSAYAKMFMTAWRNDLVVPQRVWRDVLCKGTSFVTGYRSRSSVPTHVPLRVRYSVSLTFRFCRAGTGRIDPVPYCTHDKR